VTRGRLRVLVALAAVTLLVGACGGDGGERPAVARPPAKVPVSLVPPSLTNGELTLTEDDQARKAFSELGERALVADGRLWQIRQGDQLVATLQVSTVKSKVDLRNERERTSIVRHILPGTRQEIDVDGLPISMSDSDDKTVFVWFGRDLFQVLQVKSTKLDPEAIVRDLVGFQAASPDWKALGAVNRSG
jgi:hypothetical protein